MGLLHINIGFQIESKKCKADILMIQCNPVQKWHTRNFKNLKIQYFS